jgi:hypothetical protein
VIARDRELLARVARVNTHVGEVVVELLTYYDDEARWADGLRELGVRFNGLVADLIARADEINAVPALPPHEGTTT